MQQVIEQQQTQIAQLTDSNTGNEANSNTPSSNTLASHKSPAKIPQIAPFSGKREDQTSTRVKVFVYNIRKVGQLANMTESEMLALADYYFQNRAATWMMSLEENEEKPASVAELQTAMIREFVPPDEQSRAKAKLMKLKLSRTVDGYINQFRDLVDICKTPLSEAYLFFFNGLPDDYKEEFTKKYPTGVAGSMQDAYEHARTIEMAMQWNAKPAHRTVGSSGSNGRGTQSANRKQVSVRKTPEKPSPKSSPRQMDKDSVCWGPSELENIAAGALFLSLVLSEHCNCD